jgi:hypothetical protein
MTLKTREQLKEEGFIYISTNASNGIECWAKFTGYEDNIQFVDHKEGVFTGDIQVITFGRLCLYQEMYHKTMFYPKFNQNDILSKVSEKWISIK